MPFRLLKCIAAVLALAGCTTAPPARYVQLTEVPATAEIDHEHYRFSVIPAHSYLQNTTWRVLRERKEPRNTVLLGGLPGHAYTLSVQLKDAGGDPERLARIAETHHRGMRFAPSPHNAHCLAGDLVQAGRAEAPARAYVALCLNPRTGEVFELALRERSLVADESPGGLREAMRALLDSFQFK